ncbi:uncharacterized protein [Lolium perenne]|uniref:uncharacterized protein n=1 Tax=Lolium perenne TaxID=4522 RepID=UPI003A990D45
MAGKIPPPLPPIPPSAQSVAPPSLRSTSPTMAKLTPSLQQQIGEEVPAAGDVLGDPQLQVGGEPKMSSKIHGKLPKKIRKKKSIDACGELQRASDVRDSNEVTTSLPLSKKSAKKVTIKNQIKVQLHGPKDHFRRLVVAQEQKRLPN